MLPFAPIIATKRASILFGLLTLAGLIVSCSDSSELNPEEVSEASSSGGNAGQTDKPSSLGGQGGQATQSVQPYVGGDCPEVTTGFATEVISHFFGTGSSFGQDSFPEQILGGPEGKGCCAGSLSVVSLGDGGQVVLGFGERVIVDSDGPDFLVFENAFWAGGNEENVFAELAQVSVSEDGEEWHDFPCTADEAPFGSCAGHTPVLANIDQGHDFSFEPEEAGGDAFDLADLGLSEAKYVRIVDRPGDGNVFDLDAVAIVHGRCL